MAETYRHLVENSGLPGLEARVLLESAAGRPRSWLLARMDESADDQTVHLVRRLYARRQAGEPIAYITGEREFYGLDLRITPDVLIPRPETELLVELALMFGLRDGGRAIDLGTGSGAVALALAHNAPDAEIWATDISAQALTVAEGNARLHGVPIRFLQSDWFERVPPGRFDFVIANPPYVAACDMHLDQGDVRAEPRLALIGGEDGLDCIRRIAHDARGRLEAGGWLLLEHGWDQGERCRDLLAAYGYADVASWEDLSGHPRVSGGRLN
jgi:release factor glutamine methyltransferase